jgi:hypothetical protein
MVLTEEQKRINRKESQRRYKQSPKGRKKYRTDKWIERGLKFKEDETLDDVYTRYMETDLCEICECDLTQGERYLTKTTKVMDHDHTTGYCRGIVCHSCNVSDRVKHNEQGRYSQNDLVRALALGVSLTFLLLPLLHKETSPEES